MSGSRWVITPLWLSGSWRSFLYSSSVYSYHLFLISSASVRFISFLSFIELNFAWNVSLISLIFLKRSLVFPILLSPSISLHWSLRKAFYLFLLFFGTLHSNAYIFPFFPLVFASLLLRAMWNLPGPEFELMSPELADRFLTTGPPRKSKSISSSKSVCPYDWIQGTL